MLFLFYMDSIAFIHSLFLPFLSLSSIGRYNLIEYDLFIISIHYTFLPFFSQGRKGRNQINLKNPNYI